MLVPSRVWTVLAVLYAAFFSWYTSFGGPLAPKEIDHYIEVLKERGSDPERLAVWKRFMETDTGDDFAMLNAIDLHDTPLEVEGGVRLSPRPIPGSRAGARSSSPTAWPEAPRRAGGTATRCDGTAWCWPSPCRRPGSLCPPTRASRCCV